MKKFFLTVITWLLGFPIFGAIASIVFPSTLVQVEGKDVETASGWAILTGLAISIYCTYLIFRKKKTIQPSVLKSSETHQDISHVNKASISKPVVSAERKNELKGLEKLLGPSSKTKWRWKLEDEEKVEQIERDNLKQLVSGHMNALKINWQKTVMEDEYGTKDYTKWIGELGRFFSSVNYEPKEISFEDALKIATYEVEISTDFLVLPKERTIEEKADQMILMGLVEKHQNALIRNWHKTVEQDDYGSRNLHVWHEEVGKFLSSVSFTPKAISNDLASVIVTAMVEDLVAGDPVESVFDFNEVISAYDFEEKCAEELSRIGWATRVTSGSGDQGIDVLAEKDSIRIVIQCKLYSKPVGNKAVQEAIAGKAYERADFAAVVAPNGFTRSAKELAERDGVFLFSPKDLKSLDRYLET